MAVATTMSRAVVGVKPLAARKSRALSKAAPIRTRVQALSDTNVIISGATAVTLLLGRFAFLPVQRRGVEKAGLPQQNGQTHFEAGDNLAEEVPFFTATGDPAGFNIVDLLAWGSLGHATGFALLAAASNNYENFVQ